MWEAERLRDGREWSGGGIVLDVILESQPVLIADQIVEIGTALIDLRFGVRAHLQGIVSELLGGGQVGNIRTRDQILSVGQLGLKHGQCHRIDLARAERDGFPARGGGIVRYGCSDSGGAAVVGESDGHRRAHGGTARVGDPDALVGDEIEQLVFLDRPAECRTVCIAIEERHLRRDCRIRIIKERRGVHVAVLEMLVQFAVNAVAARFGDHADVRAAIGSLRGVVHGGIHGDLLNGFGSRRGERLSDGAVYRGAGLRRSAQPEVFTGIQDEAILAHLAGGVPVKKVVGADAVQREAVTGGALAVGIDRLVPQPGVGASATQEIGVDAGRQNRQLREAPGAQRRILNGQLVDHRADGRVDLVHQGYRSHFHRGGNRSHLEGTVDGSGSAAIDQNLGVSFGIETFFGEGELVGSDRKIWDQVRPFRVSMLGDLEIGRDAGSFDGSLRHRCIGGIFYCAGDGAEAFLRFERH